MNFKRLLDEKVIISVLALCFLLIAVPRLMYPDLDHGDEWADAELLIAGANFVKFGFLNTCFLPLFEAGLHEISNPYTHYPALSCIMNGAVQGYLGITSLRFFRGLSLFISFLSVVVWYLAMRKYTQSRAAGFLFSLFYLLNPYFIYGADGLGQLSTSEALRALIIFLFLLSAHVPGRRRAYGVLVWILFFILSLITFEYAIYLAVFFVLYKLFLVRREEAPSWIYIMMLSSAPAFGFLLHLAQNACYFKGLAPALADFSKSAADRILHSKDAPMAGFGFKEWWVQVITRYFSGVFVFNYFFLGCLVFFSYLMYQSLAAARKKTVRRMLRLLAVFTVCGVTWYIAFPAHSFAHMYIPFLYRHIVPSAALGFTIFLFMLFFFLKQKGIGTSVRVILCCLAVSGIGWAGVARSDLPLAGPALREAQDFLLFKKYLLLLRSQSGPDDEIGVNYYRRPFISYYTDRRTYFLFEKKALEEHGDLPRYFLFLPFNHQAAAELHGFLEQKYRVIYTSESRLFPVVFYELIT